MKKNKATWQGQRGFTKGKSRLITMICLCDKTTLFAEEGRGVDIIYLNLSKALVSTLSPGILTSKLEWYNMGVWTDKWVKQWLEGQTQETRCWFLPYLEGGNKWSIAGDYPVSVLFNIFRNYLKKKVGTHSPGLQMMSNWGKQLISSRAGLLVRRT